MRVRTVGLGVDERARLSIVVTEVLSLAAGPDPITRDAARQVLRALLGDPRLNDDEDRHLIEAVLRHRNTTKQ